MNLLTEAIVKYLSGLLLVGALLFIPAGTLHWSEGILFMSLLFIPMLSAGILMYFKAPDLLKSRLNAKEKQSTQQDVIKYSGLLFIVSFIVAGLNERFSFLYFPSFIVMLGCLLFVFGYLLFGEVLRENAYLSRTIEVKENQKVIDTGLYGIVRHPMYSATILLFLSMPIILNSPVSFLLMLLYIPLIIKRIENEEDVLEKELTGYKEYKQKIRYRMIPFIY